MRLPHKPILYHLLPAWQYGVLTVSYLCSFNQVLWTWLKLYGSANYFLCLFIFFACPKKTNPSCGLRHTTKEKAPLPFVPLEVSTPFRLSGVFAMLRLPGNLRSSLLPKICNFKSRFFVGNTCGAQTVNRLLQSRQPAMGKIIILPLQKAIEIRVYWARISVQE
jgi:hypothetical protein